MPKPNVRVPHSNFLERFNRHDTVFRRLPTLDAKLQKLIAELIMIRMFDEFQDAISGVALRLACGASYGNGTPPTLLTSAAGSMTSARKLFESSGRKQPTNVRWSKTNFINDTTKYVLDPTDPFTQTCSRHATLIAEMLAIRNRIAHNNGNSRRAFARVINKQYGAHLNGISPGLLLLSPRFKPIPLQNYMTVSRVIVRECAGL